ncbi:MAG: hypothetical protein RIQ88_1026 [Actinomycetota bacterium]|jgi:Domain of unknown function (DUF4307)
MKDNLDPIAQRYGTKKSNPALLISIAAGLTAVFITWAVWSVFTGAKPEFKTTGYQVVDKNHVLVKYTVNKSKDQNVVCTIQALKEDYAVVGFKEIAYPAGTGNIKDSFLLKTTEPAVTGLVDNCRFY